MYTTSPTATFRQQIPGNSTRLDEDNDSIAIAPVKANRRIKAVVPAD